jgi:hypothetical protein
MQASSPSPSIQVRYEDMGTASELITEGVRVADSRDKSRKGLDQTDVNVMRQLMQVVASDEKLVDDKFTQASEVDCMAGVGFLWARTTSRAMLARPTRLPSSPLPVPFLQHYRIQSKIVEKFNSRNMHDVADIEQVLLTGVNSQGQKVRRSRAAFRCGSD